MSHLGSSIYLSKQETANSPTKVKLESITNKLINISQLASNNLIKKENYETKIRQIDEIVTNTAANDEQKFNFLKQQLSKIDESLQLQKSTREVIEEKKLKEIFLTEKNIESAIGQLKIEKNDKFLQLQKFNEEKTYSTKLETAKLKQKINEEDEIFFTQGKESIQNLYDQVEMEKNQREIDTENVITKLGDEILKLQEIMNQEKRVRESTQSDMQNLLQEMDDRFTQEIMMERKQRENTENTLLKMLEETCSKIEVSIR